MSLLGKTGQTITTHGWSSDLPSPRHAPAFCEHTVVQALETKQVELTKRITEPLFIARARCSDCGVIGHISLDPTPDGRSVQFAFHEARH